MHKSFYLSLVCIAVTFIGCGSLYDCPLIGQPAPNIFRGAVTNEMGSPLKSIKIDVFLDKEMSQRIFVNYTDTAGEFTIWNAYPEYCEGDTIYRYVVATDTTGVYQTQVKEVPCIFWEEKFYCHGKLDFWFAGYYSKEADFVMQKK